MGTTAKTKAGHANIDDYLGALPEGPRGALTKLRAAIRAAAPRAEECISYRLPAFRHEGRMLVGFGATAKHCAFYLMSDATVAAFQAELDAYDTSKGTIRFSPEEPLPAALVRKLVKARLAENAAAVPSARPPSAATNGKATAPPADGAKRGAQTPDVAQFMSRLEHPLKKEIESVRAIILGVSATIHDGIKWNSVSFRTSEYFATVNLRSRDAVQLVFHLGAKVKDNTRQLTISDPAGLIEWLAKDRCLVTLGAGKEIRKNRAALETIVREWIGQM